MTTLALLRETMTEFLQNQGIRALSAWPKAERTVRTEPLAVVRVKEVEASPAGFHRYLGEVYDETARVWTETYGCAMTATFGLALYSPAAKGEEGCRELLDRVAEAFQRGGPAGLTVEKWSMGEIAFHRDSGMFRGEVTAQCRAVLTEKTDGDGVFLAFEVKGGMELW